MKRLLYFWGCLRYIYQHIESIIAAYDGSLPLTHFLKNYYKQYPKLGSRDRKVLSEMAYCWYRCSKGISDKLSFETKLQYCLALCDSTGKHIQPFLPATNITIELDEEKLFPYNITLSEGIGKATWLKSMLTRPRMFIRIRKNKAAVLQLLANNNIDYISLSENCISIPNGSAIDNMLNAADYVVQDASSQATGHYLSTGEKQDWWDCCSGAGGKSLLLKDKEPSVNLTDTDTRSSILHNLRERFRQYGYPPPNTLVLDSSDKAAVNKALANKRFDGIICDVPCSGSGTWARTPEQLYFYDPAFVNRISQIQKNIAINASAYLKQGGKIYYITCSVFKEENEEVVAELLNANRDLQLISATLINGIEHKADSMYIAVLEKQ